MTTRAITADRIFTGNEWLYGHAILVGDNKIIKAIIPLEDLAPSLPTLHHKGRSIVPGFIDVQRYGARGRLFSALPDQDSLQALTDCNLEEGTVLCLPTVATNTYEVMHACIDAVREWQASGRQGIHGLHLEGPWINPVKRGAHVESLIHQPTMEQVIPLLEHGEGIISMITLAPELQEREVLQYIRSRGIIISAGHSDASYPQAIDAFDEGIPTVTHLFNAMSPLHHRQPGLAGATMDHGSVKASIIPDGIHVDFAALRIAKTVMKERLFVITDAVTETAMGPYQHQKKGDYFESGGVLSGSALSMDRAVMNLVLHAGIAIDEALRMCSLYPARLLGVDTLYGRIAKGYKAAFAIGSW